MKLRFLAIILLVFFIAPISAHCHKIKYEFSGSITSEVIEGNNNYADIGDVFSGMFEIDTSFFEIMPSAANSTISGGAMRHYSDYFNYAFSSDLFPADPFLVNLSEEKPYEIIYSDIVSSAFFKFDFINMDITMRYSNYFHYTGTVDTFAAVPEPSTIILISSGLLPLISFISLRRRMGWSHKQ